MENHPFTNNLIHETSPYLLQHAHNPVHWYPWGDEAWNKAKKENKLVLVSIGYSSCHWCHVMEHETFEDTVAAKVMNDHFVCIKVDREERPDVDQVYMSAVQLMTGQGGWPLNCFCLPDGRPLYGGTYFQNAQWQSVLNQLHDFYLKDPAKAESYAEELKLGMSKSEVVSINKDEMSFSKEDLTAVVANWKKYFDYTDGGPNRAPKFPMPNNYEFLLHYAVATKDESLKQYVMLTLDKMAMGGIYDQVGGGFSRYSTDTDWKVPHFEKMLYDNAQLVSLYSHAYQLTKNSPAGASTEAGDLYKQVVYETLEFIEREMTADDGGFFSALDADSDGEEGKFYVWKKSELETLLGDKFKVFAEYYNVNNKGFWEHENYILLRNETAKTVAKKNKLTEEQFTRLISDSKKILLEARNNRVRPGLDNKQLTSWNALMIKGYCDAYEAFGEKKYLDAAIKSISNILKNKKQDGSLYHVLPKSGVSSSSLRGEVGRGAFAFLEDYSFTIEALIRLYEVTFDEKYLTGAKQYADYTIRHYLDPETKMFFYTSDDDHELIVRKKEIHDNVIPASNSSIAKGLFLLNKYYDDKNYLSISQTMLHNVKPEMSAYGSSFSNWCELLTWNVFPFYEIAIAGKDAEKKRKELGTNYLPDKIIAGTVNGISAFPLLENRFVENKTLIYVCENYSCKLPVEETGLAIKKMLK